MSEKTGILIVEDDEEIAEFLQIGLSAEGYQVSVTHNGHNLLERVARDSPALLILDRMLPDDDGVDLCKQLRGAGLDTMVLMLTAKDTMDDKIDGLRAGADDYLTKPFGFGELLARLEALLRRTSHAGDAQSINIDDLRIDLSIKAAFRAEMPLSLTATEFSLLRFLAENADMVMSREEILKAVWGYDFDPTTNVVEVYISYLRKKVDSRHETKLIANVRGFGYVLRSPKEA
ncbi:response regulator transcription factor [Granulosicoccus sp. 3-233]|uniref:response regulator transcription factor n=1 Tax=Granulosicoccus sp. 3-233 TaxID=3417969 RepID=UPI003D347C89